MSQSLSGVRVALLEARRESELASLVRRHGGEPVCVPALREVERDCANEAARALDVLAKGRVVVVLATGVGLDRWLKVAATLGRRDELVRGLAQATVTVACRGPKPVAVLKREGLNATLRAPPPHTTVELLSTLETVDVKDGDAVYVHDGGGSPVVPEALSKRGARVSEVRPYGWALPEDTGPLRELVQTICDGKVDAIAVTTQIQAKHLFDVAGELGKIADLSKALQGRVLVAAVGPTCAHTLTELGVPPHVMPEQSSMGALVLALGARVRSA